MRTSAPYLIDTKSQKSVNRQKLGKFSNKQLFLVLKDMGSLKMPLFMKELPYEVVFREKMIGRYRADLNHGQSLENMGIQDFFPEGMFPFVINSALYLF